MNRLFHKELFNSKAAKPCTLRFSQVAALQHRLFLVVFVINNPKVSWRLRSANCRRMDSVLLLSAIGLSVFHLLAG